MGKLMSRDRAQVYPDTCESGETYDVELSSVSAAAGVSGSGPCPPVLPPIPKAQVSVVPELCKGCELCIYACPSGNLTLSPGLNSKGYHPVVFSYDGKRGPCTACGICYWVCPDMA